MKRADLRRWAGPLLASLLLMLFVGFAVALPPTAHADTVPYSDSNAVGTIGLCDKTGALVMRGNIHDHPFVVTTVSSEAAPPPYNGKGGKATLLAYQPREGVVPGRWSGDTLTGASEYTNKAHPMAAATFRDFSLADFLDAFPARWDGMIQLRMYLGAPDTPVLNLPYPTTDIKVSGDTWTVVRGGTGDCSVGKAVSNEVAVFGTASPSPSVPTGSTKPGASASSTAQPSTTGSPSSSGSPGAQAAGSSDPTGSDTGSDNHAVILLAGASVVLLALGGIGYSWWRERPPL